MFLPPLRRQFSREGVVQQGGFAGFVGVEDGLDFFPGGVEFRKERLDTCDNALLLVDSRDAYLQRSYFSRIYPRLSNSY